MQQGKLGLQCELCGAPVPGSVVPLGGCICSDCWDTILDVQLVHLEGPSGQAFPEAAPQAQTPAELRLALYARQAHAARGL